ncbi:hypothetical protein [Caballeronia fortuita]|uniref:hypothetical protein n=1 Tax=Caballeronia fortuita TaxID=1777138 RepID=UPI0012FD98AF|nr:hypothetical protein [Caballeronia fortuita]
MAFERGEILEVISPFMVDGEMVLAGDLIEVPTRDAADLKARKKARTPQDKGAKAASKAKAA